MRGYLLNFVCTDLGCPLPVSQRIVVSPSCGQTVSLSKFISQIRPYDPRVVFVSVCKSFSILEEHVLWKLSAPPQAVSIIIRTAPLRCTCMVVQNNHESHICKCLHSEIEDLHACFADEIRVGSKILCWNWLILEEKLKGICQSDAVHFELVPNVHSDVSQLSEL